MKKYLILSLAMFLSIGTYFLYKGSDSKADGAYITPQISYVVAGDNKIQGYEPMSNVFGGNSQRLDIELGYSLNEKKAGRYGDISSVFVYSWLHDSKKNNEYGIGIGGRYTWSRFDSIPLKPYLQAKAGVGYQPVTGKNIDLDTNLNMITYTSGNVSYGNYKGTFLEDTYVVEIGLGLGCEYPISDNWDLRMGMEYLFKKYQFAYSIEGLSGSNYGDPEQDNYQFGLGLKYKF